MMLVMSTCLALQLLEPALFLEASEAGKAISVDFQNLSEFYSQLSLSNLTFSSPSIKLHGWHWQVFISANM